MSTLAGERPPASQVTRSRPALPQAASARRNRRLDALAVAGPVLLAGALCAYQLTSRSLWLDEAATASIAASHGGAFGAALARDGGNMLGYYGLMHLLIGAFGSGAAILRLPSVVAGCLTTGLVGAICLKLWDRRVAASAGVLTAVSLTLVYWSQDARGYALMIALIAGSFLALVLLVEAERATWLHWLGYATVTAAAVYAGLEAALVVPAQLLVLAWRRDRTAAVVSALAAAGVACVPLAVLAAERGSGQLFWVPAPSLRTAKQVLQALTSSGLQPAYYTATGDALLVLTLIALLVGAAMTAARWRARAPEARAATLMLGWLVVPPLLALVLSLAGHSIFQARYALVSLPAVSIVLAWALWSAPMPRLVAVGGIVALVALRALALAPSYGVSTEQWRTATSFVAAHSGSGDCIAFYPQDARMPFEYYGGAGGAAGRLPAPVLPALPWGRVRSFVEQYGTLTPRQAAALPERCARVWLVWSHEGRLGGPAVSGANFERLQRLRGELGRSYPANQRRSFGRASPISIELFSRATGAA